MDKQDYRDCGGIHPIARSKRGVKMKRICKGKLTATEVRYMVEEEKRSIFNESLNKLVGTEVSVWCPSFRNCFDSKFHRIYQPCINIKQYQCRDGIIKGELASVSAIKRWLAGIGKKVKRKTIEERVNEMFNQRDGAKARLMGL